MIRLTCDRCERTLEVPDDKAGTKFECPDCGDINLVPGVRVGAAPAPPPPPAHSPGGGRGAAAPRPDRAAEMGLPPDSGPEKTVLNLRPAMFRARPGLFCLIMLAVVGGAVGAGIFAFRPQQAVWAWAFVALAVVGLIALAVWKIRTLALRLQITNKRTVEVRGLFSRRTSEVLHEDIRNIQIDQTFLQRVWRVGSIGISSAGQDGLEIHAEDIPRPLEVKRVIDAYRDKVN